GYLLYAFAKSYDVHGIGLCEGIQKITSSDGEVKDYVVVLYKNGDRLYVPADATDMLSRYSGGENPALSKLGGEDFARVKSKVKSGIKEMSINLLKLYSEREKARGFKYRIDEYLDNEFQQYFPYTATEDQLRCHREIVKDLTSNRIMDRVLVGDVGYGKTEVAMRTAFDVVSNGYQVAVLVPTTILAEQHYATFSERMSHFDIKVACLNRFKSAEEQKKIMQDVSRGTVDIVIGTHRLLSKDVSFSKLGLLILDEEQRFGVEHKEKIKTLKTNVDVLTMSATPIPRTLHMALSGIRDISTITTPPVQRMAVETFVAEENEALITDVVTRELARGGQVYCVFNRVEQIDGFARNLSEMLPNAKIAVAHGQMNENVLEDSVRAFANGEFDVLVCTTIIENGIDIPNVNTLIVIDADKLGLSQLYQLRGRVGRSNRLAYAYFTYRKDKILSEVAYKRLSSITEYSELGSGFKIAMKDLEIRGAGNILGREQHGHMMKVGYDMYARLLKETVDELKGEKTQPKISTEVSIDIEAFAPDGYIPLQADRMSFYQQLASCKTQEEIAEVKNQLADVYGVIPKQVDNLFTVARLKLLANAAGIIRVTAKTGKGELVFANRDKMMRKEVFEALSECGDRVSAASDTYGVLFNSFDFLQKDRLLSAMEEFLLRIQP
ncbi:MAG: transcription-repair coupling factor, partial [Firmicutes bacterium]|nr:transcription-repair coupling factor [Bacillota bacterium]